jgi:hypothetical protein
MWTSVPVTILLALAPAVVAAQSPAAHFGPAAQPQSQTQTPAPTNVPALSPSQRMPSPPGVSYTDGKLTVTANNSTVQDVITAVHGATGTAFQVNGGPLQDRLFGQYGPGPVNAVLEQILRGSGFNYILVSAPETPGQVKNATLMAKSNEASTPAIPPPQPQNVNQQPNDQEAQPDANVGGDEEPPPPEPAQPEPTQETPQAYPQGVPNGEAQPQDPNQPKTPEQLLQELQRLQQLRQQQIQQANPQNPQ